MAGRSTRLFVMGGGGGFNSRTQLPLGHSLSATPGGKSLSLSGLWRHSTTMLAMNSSTTIPKKKPSDKDETIRAVRGLQRECPSAHSPAYIAEHAHDIRRTLLRASFLALSGAAASRDAARKSRLIAARK